MPADCISFSSSSTAASACWAAIACISAVDSPNATINARDDFGFLSVLIRSMPSDNAFTTFAYKLICCAVQLARCSSNQYSKARAKSPVGLKPAVNALLPNVCAARQLASVGNSVEFKVKALCASAKVAKCCCASCKKILKNSRLNLRVPPIKTSSLTGFGCSPVRDNSNSRS